MPLKCRTCGNENADDALYCGVCQNVFRKEKAADAPPGPSDQTGGGAGPGGAQPAARSATAAGEGGLGELLFEKKNPLVVRMLWTIISICFTIFSAGALTVAGLSPVGPLIGLLMGLGLGVASLMAWFSTLRCYELGVVHRGLSGTTALRYGEIGSFSYSETEQHTKGGMYISTNYFFEFSPAQGAPGKRIRFSVVQRHDEDGALGGLRDRVAAAVAPRLLEEVRRAGIATWTENLRILRGGLAYRPSGLMGRGEFAKISWEQILDHVVDSGMFKLAVVGSEDAVFTESVSAPNFFPGLLAFENLKRTQVFAAGKKTF